MPRANLHSYRAILIVATMLLWPELRAAEPPRPAFQQEYWARFDRRDWDGAIASAERLVENARQLKPPEPLRLAEMLSMLGNAQLGKGNYIVAEQAFAEALQLVERHSIPTSSDLLTPLRGLGHTLAAAGRHAEAVPPLERALLISHRNHGLFDIGQQGILRLLATSLTHSGRLAEAEKHMTYLLRVGERSYGADDVRVTPIMNSVADWFSETGNFGAARQLYRMALEIVEKKLGPNDLAAVAALRGFAGTFTEELYFSTLGLVVPRERPALGNEFTIRSESRPINPKHLSADGQQALERALQILDASPDRPVDVLAATLVQLGDWHQIKEEPESARAFYERAWSVEGTAPDESGKARLEFPVRLYYPMPLSASRTLHLKPEQSEERYVQMDFTVTSEGTVANARIVEENASTRQASDALDAIRAARFRPKFVDGAPVDTPAVTYREVFRSRKKSDETDSS